MKIINSSDGIKRQINQPILLCAVSVVGPMKYKKYNDFLRTCNILFNDFLAHLIIFVQPCYNIIKSVAWDSTENILKKVETYLNDNYYKDINLRILASTVGLTAPYLSKLFKSYKVKSLVEYIIHLKVEKAKSLMRSNPDMLTKEISDLLGYSDPFYFSRIFKKFTGSSPSDYRRTLESSSSP